MRPHVLLDDYAYMSNPDRDHAHAVAVGDFVTGRREPRMPPGGPYWTAAQIAL